MQSAAKLMDREPASDVQQNTLLIVEDDDALRDRLSQAMTRRGFVVSPASSVADAHAMISVSPPQFAIVDLRLLDGTGLTVVDTLRQTHPSCRTIVLTGYGNIPTAVAAARIGAVDYIAKPATADEIVDVLLTPEGQRPPPPTDTVEPEEARRVHIEKVYADAGENVSHTARLLNMHRRTLQRLLKRNGVTGDASK